MESRFNTSFDKIIPFFIFMVTGLVFLPVINWLTEQTFAHEQLLHAFLVFVLTGALLVYERRIGIRPVFEFSDTAQNVLILSYALLVAAIFSRINLVLLAALSLSLLSLLLFIFGNDKRRLILSSIGAFTIFTAFAVMFPVMDWPLRSIAGKWAGYGLQLIGQNVQLGIFNGQNEPMLMLLNNGRPFHVAAECNGFGMITSCLLMAAILVLYRKLSFFDRLGWMGMALIIGLLFNSIRIIIIVILAPLLSDSSYMLMHEAVGLLTTYGGLGVLYFLLMPRERDTIKTL
ncbi:exosortase/archaeosortase family protein [Puniceicoccales bacterium CK1056]|uniref:Exosortase/archaeosortase family protein n=1 Tax=Oceanipulchritudo coccoides TaxID=2706888 RepID=A0A6B2M0B8_9BACT|nr:archaeosortase/exosortase family protein [Oceanipulchritudo coccoides]NDV62401.1 exosortase/archaeosortase family protein [Oceanipulchritudo coccoides]